MVMANALVAGEGQKIGSPDSWNIPSVPAAFQRCGWPPAPSGARLWACEIEGFVPNSREEVSRKMRGSGRGKTRGWMIAATVTAMLVLAAASGDGRDPCRTAYLASGLSQAQVTFEEFAEFYGEGLCAPPGALAHSE